MRARAQLLCAFLGALLLPAAAPAETALPTATLDIAGQRAYVEVAATGPARLRGLMHRKSLGANQGMLFVFDVAAIHCMWMKDTPVPLSVAFADAQGIIVNLADMTPLSTESHCASAPARYALEMPQGWFRRHRIGAGAEIQVLRPTPATPAPKAH